MSLELPWFVDPGMIALPFLRVIMSADFSEEQRTVVYYE